MECRGTAQYSAALSAATEERERALYQQISAPAAQGPVARTVNRVVRYALPLTLYACAAWSRYVHGLRCARLHVLCA
jgi:hypothetical protein